MGKKLAKLAAGSILAGSLLVGGCSLIPKDETVVIDPPKDVTYKSGKLDELTKGTSDGVLNTDLYVRSEEGYIMPVTVFLPETTSVAKQVLQYLVMGGPALNVLPSGFTPILPKGTEFEVNLQKDDTIVVNFNKKFLDYKEKDEQQIFESITWSLTQFKEVKRVVVQVEGKVLTEKPFAKTPITNFSREMGINHDDNSVVDIRNSKTATVYYVTQEDESSYYVPVTKRMSNKDDVSTVEQIVNELVQGAGYSSPLVTEFNKDVVLNDAEISKGNVTLNFNKNIYTNPKNKEISSSLLHALVLSLTEQPSIDTVKIKVEGESVAVDENGKKLTEPVTRPLHINTGKF